MKNLTRREFVKISAVGFAGLLSGCRPEEIPPKLPIKFLRQIVTKDISTSRLVMWQVDEPLTNPFVEIHSANEAAKIFPARDTSFRYDGKEIFQYTAQIENLPPNKIYDYRIIDGDAASDWHTLKKVSGDKFKALIFPDSQCGNGYETWGDVARLAFEKNLDAEFFVNVGDLVDNGEDSSQWEDWLSQVEKFLPSTPFAPVPGNHETYSRQWTVIEPQAYLNYFEPPDNHVENFSRRFYSFDYGAAHFAILDSQWDELDAFTPNLVDVQKSWLREDFSSTSKPWKIVFVHKDVLQYRINGRPERREGFSDVGEIFMPEFDSLGVDVVFTGHLHTYRNRGRLKNFLPDETGALYILTGLSGNVRYDGLWIDHAFDKVKAPQPEIDNFLTLEVDEKNLSVKCFLNNGELLDEVTLQKA
ncbi:MAG: metallophosphoesterase family protein [Selenomonadaceae bacterium]|nr:metallophosphoesterase family protein [Selenomonadaceae bacterium]